jgi:hypothetical protein
MALSSEHRAKIAAAISLETPELIAKIRDLRDQLPLRSLCIAVGISYATLCRIIRKHDIQLTANGRRRAAKSSKEAQLGNVPWNKDRSLSSATKTKISMALRGKPGHRMTNSQKTKWRRTYFSRGVHMMRRWLASEEGRVAAEKSSAATTHPAFRASQSRLVANLVADGIVHTNRGHGVRVITQKGDTFRTKSTYETRYVQILETDDNVERFYYEPLQIPYEFNGQQLMYTPDFLVYYKDGHEELVEIKPKSLVSLPKNAAKISAGMQFHAIFRVITEEELNVADTVLTATLIPIELKLSYTAQSKPSKPGEQLKKLDNADYHQRPGDVLKAAKGKVIAKGSDNGPSSK